MLWAPLDQSVTLCDAFANVELPAAGKHEIPGLDGVF
jgi:hypothetical protein